MGKLLKIKVLFAVAVMFMMAGGSFSPFPDRQVSEVQTADTASVQHEFSEDSRYFSDFALHESGYTTLSNGPVFSYAKQWEAFKAVINASIANTVRGMARTVAEIIYFPLRISKADLLFPFHYFF